MSRNSLRPGPFLGTKEVWLPHIPQGSHILRQQKELFQGFSPFWNSLMKELYDMAAPSSFSQGSHARFWGCTSATVWSSLLSTEKALPLPLAVFYCLDSFWRTNSPSLANSFSFLFFFRLVTTNGLTVGGGGGGRARGGWDPEASLGADFLALFARSSCKPLFLFIPISYSSSSELSST